MTQIAQGAHVYLFPEPGQVYRVQADDVATVQVLYGAPSAVIALTAQSQTFGPYDSPAKLKVTANTAPAEYTLIRAHYAELTPEQIEGGAVGVLGSNNAGGVVEPDGDVPTLGGSVTLPAMQTAFAAGTAPERAAFQSSVSGDRVAALPLRWDQQSTPLVISHRGGMAIGPQSVQDTFDQSVTAGQRILEFDVRKTSDGVLVVFHDATVDAMTDGTGTIESKTWAQVQALNMDGIQSVYGPAWPATAKILSLEQAIDRYRTLALFAIEDKGSPSVMEDITALLTAKGIPKRQVLLQQGSGGIAQLTAAAAAGWPCLFLTTSGEDISAATLTTAGIKYVGGSYASLTQAKYDEFSAAGLTVFSYTISRKYQLANVLARGGGGCFSDSPAYTAAKTATTTLSQFHLQKYADGMLGAFDEAQDSTDPAYRGEFFAPNYWGYSSSATGYRGCLMGNLSPISTPTSFDLFFRLTFNAVTDAGRWASVFLGETDTPFLDNAGQAQGNHVLIRQNGGLAVYTKAAGAGAAAVGSGTSQVMTLGTEYFFKISVRPTTITVAMTDSAGTTLYSYVATTSLYRGGYLTLGRSNAAVRYRQLRILAV